jgi:serine/threonine protein kinase/TolB-like protein/Flp pilus assembly protein TadD
MIGQTISRYRILSKIGAGGMGEVYMAEDERLGRKLALKILPEQFTQDEDRVRRFEQEARAASALNHPNIITIYEIGKINTGTGDLHFIATEFIEGETLRERSLSRKLDLSEALEIAIQCCNALQAAHKAGIAHRDIKPENIMLRPDGYIKILDFGLAKLTEQIPAETEGLEAPAKSVIETKPGIVMGTIDYMSPEQARGQRIDGRTDIFSLGVVLYEMVSGRRPFTGATISDIIAALLVSEPKRLSQHLPNAPVELERIVTRMLAKDREARYQSAQEVLNDLKRFKSRVELVSESIETAPLEAPGAGMDISSSIRGEDKPTAGLFDTNIAPQPNLQAPMQSGYETNVIPCSPQTIGHTATAQARKSKLRRFLLPALAGLAILLAAGLVSLWFARFIWRIDSIAVLPFVNVTNDPDADYLTEGIAEGIINTLSRWPDLSVTSRNSVIQYKGREVNAREVGRELDVKAVLLGRIQRRGDSLTINAELVDARNGRQIWGERFERKISDLLATQDEIARNISNKLQLRLTDAQSPTAIAGTKNAEAYDLYLKGRYFWNQGTLDAMVKADEYFEAAAARDSDFAPAIAGCAACHAAGSDGERPLEGMVMAKYVAMKALKADENLVDAHITLATVNLRYDWNFKEAESEFKRALELGPRNALAHTRYAEFLALMGRHKDALNELNQARQIDPRSLPTNHAFGTLAYYSRNYPDAIQHLRKTIEIAENFAPAHSTLGLVYEQQGNTQDAILEFLRAKIAMRADQQKTSALKKAYADQGREAFWREYLSQLEKDAEERYVPQTAIAAARVRLGDIHRALDALDKAFDEKDGGLVELKVEPLYEPLRAHTRYEDLLRRIGLAKR